MTDLDAKASAMTFAEALERVSSRMQTRCSEPECNSCRLNREALAVLKEEGDRRAEEMRERCAQHVGSWSGSPIFANGLRSLPLDPKEKADG